MRRGLSLLTMSLLLNMPALPRQDSPERAIRIPVAGVTALQGEVLVDIAYDAKTIEVLETLERDLVRLLKKTAGEFPDSASLRLRITNRGEKLCELGVPTEAVAKCAAGALSCEAMLSQVDARLFVSFQERIAAELEPGTWPRLSDGGFFASLEAARMEDEWKALDESPAEDSGERALNDVEPSGEVSGGVPGWEDLGRAEAPAGSGKQTEAPGVLLSLKSAAIVLGGIVLIITIVTAALRARRRAGTPR